MPTPPSSARLESTAAAASPKPSSPSIRPKSSAHHSTIDKTLRAIQKIVIWLGKCPSGICLLGLRKPKAVNLRKRMHHKCQPREARQCSGPEWGHFGPAGLGDSARAHSGQVFHSPSRPFHHLQCQLWTNCDFLNPFLRLTERGRGQLFWTQKELHVVPVEGWDGEGLGCRRVPHFKASQGPAMQASFAVSSV